MDKKVIAIASDHAGVELKAQLKEALKPYASEVLDLGAHGKESVDYSDYGNLLAKTLLEAKADSGVAICGSGIGISMALNRHKTIRAALCHDGLTATLARRHNNANVLCLGARLIGEDTAKDCVKQFFSTAFEGGRHEKRISKLDN